MLVLKWLKINCLMLYSQKNNSLVLSKYPHWDPPRSLEKIYIVGSPSSLLEKKPTINSWKRQALYDSVLSYERNRWKLEHVIRNSMGNEIWPTYNDK